MCGADAACCIAFVLPGAAAQPHVTAAVRNESVAALLGAVCCSCSLCSEPMQVSNGFKLLLSLLCCSLLLCCHAIAESLHVRNRSDLSATERAWSCNCPCSVLSGLPLLVLQNVLLTRHMLSAWSQVGFKACSGMSCAHAASFVGCFLVCC